MDISRFEDCICVKDFAALAEKRVSSSHMTFLNTGAMEEQTLEENCTAFRKWRFQPRCMRNVREISLKSTVMGQDVNIPIGMAPTGQMKWFSEAGEIDAARAAESHGVVYTESSFSSVKCEDIVSSTPNGLHWFQLYMLKDRSITSKLVENAERNGVKAFVLTVDFPILGKRCRFFRTQHIKPDLAEFHFPGDNHDGLMENIRDCRTTWEHFDWLRSITRLPIVIKGVLTPESALEAVNRGVSAVWVSNHGGRQLDGVLPTIYALPGIARAVEGRCPVFIDGGIRTGGDVAKAIALGADCVFVGRPIVWGVASGGAEGAKKVLEILSEELSMTMKLLGVTSIEELKSDPDLIVHESKVVAEFS